MTEEKVRFSNGRGEWLAGIAHYPRDRSGNSAVILCHGMESNKDSDKLILLARTLAEHGVFALRFDFTYCGESSGSFADITCSGEVEDLRAAFDFVAHSFRKIAIFGSSMGGTVALLFAAKEASVAGLVTFAAPVHPEDFPRRLLSDAEI